MKTFVATPENRERDWVVVDATGQTLGRLATEIADNTEGQAQARVHAPLRRRRLRDRGQRGEDRRHRQEAHQQALPPPFRLPGGLRTRTLNDMLEREPEEVIRKAVKGMLRRNRLGASSRASSSSTPGPRPARRAAAHRTGDHHDDRRRAPGQPRGGRGGRTQAPAAPPRRTPPSNPRSTSRARRGRNDDAAPAEEPVPAPEPEEPAAEADAPGEEAEAERPRRRSAMRRRATRQRPSPAPTSSPTWCWNPPRPTRTPRRATTRGRREAAEEAAPEPISTTILELAADARYLATASARALWHA